MGWEGDNLTRGLCGLLDLRGGRGGGRGGGVCCFCGWEEGPALDCSGHIFFAVPSPLSLLLFKLTLISISSGAFTLFFFLCFLGDVFGVVAAGLGDAAGADVTGAGVAGVGVAGVADAGVTGGSGVAFAATTATAAAAAWAFFWGGDELFSPCLGDPFLFLATSVQPSWLVDLGWAGPGPLASASLLIVVVVAAASPFVVVVVNVAFSLFSGRWRQNLAIWPIYTPSTWGVFPPPSQSSADPRKLTSPGWLWSHPLSGTAGRHSPRRLSRPGIWGG